MYPISSIQSNLYSYRSPAVRVSSNNALQQQSSIFFGKTNTVSQPSFAPVPAQPTIRTRLNPIEEKKYSELTAFVDKHSKKQLKSLLQNGILLNQNSNDNSTVLDNLYKVMTEPRAEGLDPKMVLKETINTVANPFAITQNFGDIPKTFKNKVVNQEAQTNTSTNLLERKQSMDSVEVEHSSDCVAASIEFNLAKQMPSEFSRFAEQLTSPKLAVEKTIKMKNLTDNDKDSIWLLNSFEVPYKMENKDKVKLILTPDKNALLRAQIQNVDKDPLERSLVDVMMQSTFMNVGSQQTYDSLTDIRGGKFNNDNRGLIEFEKTFTESVVEDKNKTSVTYQTVDNNKVVGYETDFGTIKKQLLDSLAIGENVIIGYTQLDSNNNIVGGHEITIIGAAKDKNGKVIFICNDTDDNISEPIAYPEDYIIPKIHHAGLPQQIAAKYPELTTDKAA